MTHEEVQDVVQGLFPSEAGAALAQAFLQRGGLVLATTSMEIDLTRCKPAMLIGAFFHSFLQHIVDIRPDLLEDARRILWRLSFEFQRENVAQWVKGFDSHV